MKKISIILLICLFLNNGFCVNAEQKINDKFENNTAKTAETVEAVEDILNEFENNSDGLQGEVDKVIEENSENFFVKLFKSIIDAISKFLDALFKLALEATKIR